GNENYNPATANTTTTIIKEDTKIILTGTDTSYDENTIINGTLNDMNGNPIVNATITITI
ncbi:MAG: hypothetical protein BZ138_03905, partial [Methanosphaera sp. rholeuAM270]